MARLSVQGSDLVVSLRPMEKLYLSADPDRQSPLKKLAKQPQVRLPLSAVSRIEVTSPGIELAREIAAYNLKVDMVYARSTQPLHLKGPGLWIHVLTDSDTLVVFYGQHRDAVVVELDQPPSPFGRLVITVSDCTRACTEILRALGWPSPPGFPSRGATRPSRGFG
jgi:hypothetical protein